MANGVKQRIKQHLCGRDLEPGDLVKVTEGAKWKAFQHKIGGMGHWAIFVRKRGGKADVRPVLANGMHMEPVEVSRVEHINDVINAAAMTEYLAKRGGGEE
jgi:hypothetical protein